MPETIQYLEDTINQPLKLIDAPLWWQKQGLQQTTTGYGSKLTTSKKVKIGNRLYRIYCVCYSNAGSCYIIKNGKRLFLKYSY